MSDEKKVKNGRWNKGGVRYPDSVRDQILTKYREQDGWHRGARVTRRSK